MDNMEGVGELQRRQVVKMLMDILKSCYPAEHDYLILRSKQYESMCYTRASTIHHYYQLVNEGFRKIRAAYNIHGPAAPNSGLVASAGTQVNPGIQNVRTLVDSASQGVRCTLPMVDQAAKTRTNLKYNLENESNCINPAHPPNPLCTAHPVNPNNNGVYLTNPRVPVHSPTGRQISQIQINKEGYMVNPAATMGQPLSAGNAQLNHFANHTLNGMISTSAPSATNRPIHQMFKTVGNPVITPTVNPSQNLNSSHVAVNPAVNPFFNSSVNPGVNQIISQMNDTNQSNSENQRPMVNQVGITSVNPTGVFPSKAYHVAAPIQTPNHETNKRQTHPDEVDQLLLSMGMIPESMISGVPTVNVNRTRMPINDSNQVPTIPQNPVQLPRQVAFTQDPSREDRKKSVMTQVPVSRADSALSQPRSATRKRLGELSSHCRQPVSTSSIGSKRARPRDMNVQRSRPKKRNSSNPRINTQENSSSSAQHGNIQSTSKHVFNFANSGAATSIHHQNQLRAMESTQRKPDGPTAHPQNPEEQLSISNPSMKQRIFISDSIHVSVGQVCTAAASCGYRLTVDQISKLPKEQVLRLFIRARQIALTEACNLPRGENGQVNVSKQQLDTLGVEYQTNESSAEQTGIAIANPNGIHNSSAGIAQQHSLPSNMRRNEIDIEPRTEDSQSKSCQTNKAGQSAPTDALCNSVQELPDHQDSRQNESLRVTMPVHSVNGPPSSAAQGTEKVPASQHKTTASGAPLVSNKDARLDRERVTGNLANESLSLAVNTKAGSNNKNTVSGAQATQKRPADTQTLRNGAAALSSRLTLFQKKYRVYRNLINQTLNFLISIGHEGKTQVLYMRYSLQLLTKPADLGTKLTISLLNTIEHFLRDFLVRYQGVPMKSQPKQNIQPDATKAKGSPTVNNDKRRSSSNAEISGTNQALIAANSQIGKGTETTPPKTSEANPQAIAGAQADQSDPAIKPKNTKPLQKDTSVTPSAQTSPPTKFVSDEGMQNATSELAAVPQENLQSLIAQKLNRVNHYVRKALHMAELCEKGLEQESMLRLKEERISEICNIFQHDHMKKARELKEIGNAEGEQEPSLLEMIKKECDGAYKKHKKLMINIKEKWNKPIIECVLAYQCIRLPKIVIHVGGTYRKDLCASFGFERPPLGWVPVLADIKERFMALMDEKDGVSAILEAWASAAEEVLEVEDVQK